MKFAWIQTEKATYPPAQLCRWLDVTRSGFYAWRGRPESTHTRDDRRLKVLVRASFEASKQRYGSPRVHEDLLEQDEYVSRKRVVRLMQEDGLKARLRKRYKLTTMSDPDQPVAANLLDRQFEADAPNQRWVGDTTEFVIGGTGKLYFAAILDLFSRFIVGWAVSAVNDRHLTIKALQMALKRRCPDAGLLHHSDQGCTGEFNRSSRRLNSEELRWEHRNVVWHIGRDVLRCGRRGVPRRDAVSTGVGSGQRSPAGCPAKMRRWRPAYPSRLERDGSAKMEACRRSAWPRSRGAICRLPSEKKLQSCTPGTFGFVISLGESAAPRRQSRGSYVAMLQPAVADLSIALRPRSGTPTGRRKDRRWRSWLHTTSCAGTCKTDSKA